MKGENIGMNNGGRTGKAFVNMFVGMGCYFLSVIVSLIYRTIFILMLNGEYLGMQGVFTNVLALLSLSELGIGSAMTFSMYKPLAQGDEKKICSLLELYKRVYRVIALLVLVVGLALTPFLGWFFETRPAISESLEIIYILYVLNTALSYLIVYKHSILQADQNGYVVVLWSNVFIIVRSVFQIVWLCIFKTFIPTLIIQLVLSVISNVYISHIATKKYPYIKNMSEAEKIDKVELKDIVTKIKAMFLYRIGAYAVNSTDNLLISKFVSVLSVGIYSNYVLILGLAKSVTNYIGTALTPGIGNQVETESPERNKGTFNTLYFMYFWLSSVTTICFAVLLNPFIELWVGTEYLLPELTVGFLLINYYILMMRRLMVSYRNAIGLYVQARYKPVLEAVINLVASLILLRYWGVLGVVVGTTISEVTTSLWIEPHILFKHYFKNGYSQYWKQYIVYSGITVALSLMLVSVRNMLYTGSILSLLLIAVITFVVTNLLIIILFRKSKEYVECKLKVLSIFRKLRGIKYEKKLPLAYPVDNKGDL